MKYSNLETAMDRAKLKEMGISHILNTAAYKEYLQGKINTRAVITYYGVLVMDGHRFDISKDLFPASEFIHKTLSNTENKLLVHCIDGDSHSATLFSGDAIDHVIDKRWIRPNRDFLKQLTILDSNLKSQPILKLKKRVQLKKQSKVKKKREHRLKKRILQLKIRTVKSPLIKIKHFVSIIFKYTLFLKYCGLASC
uniref:Dual specificity phosphatase catalytic domain-containing protein n=1 Tax=Cyprinus carpio TaxID=7962 RepID=A0A8C1LNT7_CYPCA